MVFRVAEFQLPLIHGATWAYWCLPIKNWLDSGSYGADEIESKTQKRKINLGKSTSVLLLALFIPICNAFHRAGSTFSQSHVSQSILPMKRWKREILVNGEQRLRHGCMEGRRGWAGMWTKNGERVSFLLLPTPTEFWTSALCSQLWRQLSLTSTIESNHLRWTPGQDMAVLCLGPGQSHSRTYRGLQWCKIRAQAAFQRHW